LKADRSRDRKDRGANTDHGSDAFSLPLGDLPVGSDPRPCANDDISTALIAAGEIDPNDIDVECENDTHLPDDSIPDPPMSEHGSSAISEGEEFHDEIVNASWDIDIEDDLGREPERRPPVPKRPRKGVGRADAHAALDRAAPGLTKFHGALSLWVCITVKLMVANYSLVMAPIVATHFTEMPMMLWAQLAARLCLLANISSSQRMLSGASWRNGCSSVSTPLCQMEQKVYFVQSIATQLAIYEITMRDLIRSLMRLYVASGMSHDWIHSMA
jgi:hypothetical protein